MCLKLVNNNLKTNRQHTNNSDPALLNELHRQDRVLFSPFDNKYGICTAQYDDRCTLDLAVRNDAAIITNDNFRDLINENAGKMLHLKLCIQIDLFIFEFIDWRRVIENRVISFTFCKDTLILPQDPYGRQGPSLDQILNAK